MTLLLDAAPLLALANRRDALHMPVCDTVVRDLEDRYASLDLGLAGCSTIVLARRLGTRALLTFDERHFRAATPLQGGAFTLLPADGA